MRTLVESLKRLYEMGKLTKKQINGMKSITEDEKRYILDA